MTVAEYVQALIEREERDRDGWRDFHADDPKTPERIRIFEDHRIAVLREVLEFVRGQR